MFEETTETTVSYKPHKPKSKEEITEMNEKLRRE